MTLDAVILELESVMSDLQIVECRRALEELKHRAAAELQRNVWLNADPGNNSVTVYRENGLFAAHVNDKADDLRGCVEHESEAEALSKALEEAGRQ